LRGLFAGNFEGEMRTALKTELLPLWKLCEGNLKGGLLYWGPWRMCKKAPETGKSLHKGPVGEPLRDGRKTTLETQHLPCESPASGN